MEGRKSGALYSSSLRRVYTTLCHIGPNAVSGQIWVEQKNGISSRLIPSGDDEQIVVLYLKSAPSNSLSTSFVSELDKYIKQYSTPQKNQPRTSAILLISQIPNLFCSGAEISFLGSQQMAKNIGSSNNHLSDVFSLIESSSVPIVACISNLALGGGLELALSCHYRLLSSQSCLLGLPEISLGVLPAAGGTQRLPRLIGLERSLQCMISNFVYTNPLTALKHHLVDAVHNSNNNESFEQWCVTWVRNNVIHKNVDQRRTMNKKQFLDEGDERKLLGVIDSFEGGQQDKRVSRAACLEAVRFGVRKAFEEVRNGSHQREIWAQCLAEETRQFHRCLPDPAASAHSRWFFTSRQILKQFSPLPKNSIHELSNLIVFGTDDTFNTLLSYFNPAFKVHHNPNWDEVKDEIDHVQQRMLIFVLPNASTSSDAGNQQKIEQFKKKLSIDSILIYFNCTPPERWITLPQIIQINYHHLIQDDQLMEVLIGDFTSCPLGPKISYTSTQWLFTWLRTAFNAQKYIKNNSRQLNSNQDSDDHHGFHYWNRFRIIPYISSEIYSILTPQHLSSLPPSLPPSPSPFSSPSHSSTPPNLEDDNDVVIVCAFRTPFTKADKGGLKTLTSSELLYHLFSFIIRFCDIHRIPLSRILDINIGTIAATIFHIRSAWLLSGGLVSTPCKKTDRLCASGLSAIAEAIDRLKSYTPTDNGPKFIIAGGVESMSTMERPKNVIPNRGKGNKLVEGVFLPMGITSENVSERFSVSRSDMDQFSAHSQALASDSQSQNRLRAEIIPITDTEFEHVNVVHDDGIRPTTAQALNKLKPAFKPTGSSTAGNSSQRTDGGALVLLTTRREAKNLHLPILGSMKSFEVIGVEPEIMGVGPLDVVPIALKSAGIQKEEVDLWEINEAFGSQVVYCMRGLGIGKEGEECRVNVNGGAIALGHPLGGTGARLVATILRELKRRKKKVGVISMCVGSGMGAAAVFQAE